MISTAMSPTSARLKGQVPGLPNFQGDFFEHQRDPVANEMAAFPARDRQAFMEHWTANILGNDTGRKRTILLDGEVVGNILSWEHVRRHARGLLDRA